MRIAHWFRRLWGRYGPARRLQIIEGDTLPSDLPARDLVLTRDDGDDWSVGMRCPCGCGDTIELMILRGHARAGISASTRPDIRRSIRQFGGSRDVGLTSGFVRADPLVRIGLVIVASDDEDLR